MNILEAVLLGLVQGLTEFIPVSSTGHLVLVREFFDIKEGGLAFDAVLQLATSLAIGTYFIKTLPEVIRDKTLLHAIVIGTIPAVVIGLVLEDKIETVFRSPILVAMMLVAGSLLMILADKHPTEDHKVTKQTGLLIGFYQSLALLPGFSRSGATISGGVLSGLSRDAAVRFSFLLSFPILMGSGLKKLLDLHQAGSLSDLGWPLLFGSIAAFGSGLWAINFLIKYLKTHKFKAFIWYRIALAGVILLLTFI